MTIKERLLIFKQEYNLKWRDLYKIREVLTVRLKQLKLARLQADPIIIILSELLENAFKYSDKKVVTIIIKYASADKKRISVKLHHPVATFRSRNVKMMLSDISKVNSAEDVTRIFVDSLREATKMNAKANKFRLALIRKTAGGSLVHIKKSMIYKPGLSIAVSIAIR